MTSGISASYNLLDEPWIPVLRTGGEVRQVGVREALRESPRIRGVAASSPLDRVAICRLLLALLYWCRENPPGAPASEGAGELFPAEVLRKLDVDRECFDLLGPNRRFYQTRSSGKRDLQPVGYLRHEIPTGTSASHFRHAVDGAEGLCPACCAIGLIRLPAFTPIWGRTFTHGINGKPPVYAVPVGATLEETLRLSWSSVGQIGTPAWIQPELKLPSQGDVPVLTGLTWLPWRVWIDDPRGEIDACAACGHRAPLIHHLVRTGVAPVRGFTWEDPHVLRDRRVVTPVDSLSNPAGAAAQGVKLLSLLDQTNGAVSDVVGRTWLVAFATDRAKFLDVQESSVPRPDSPDDVPRAAREFERWQRSMHRVSTKDAKRKPLYASIFPQLEHLVSTSVQANFADGGGDGANALYQHRVVFEAVASALFPGRTSSSLRRQRELAGILVGGEGKGDGERRGSKTRATSGLRAAPRRAGGAPEAAGAGSP